MDSPQRAVDGPQLLGLLALHHVRHRIGRLRVLDTGGILNNIYHSNDTTSSSLGSMKVFQPSYQSGWNF